MDGGPIFGPVTGGTPQNFSQEVVREFQVSTLNFDLSTGLTGSGAINVATRYGGNAHHGSAFCFSGITTLPHTRRYGVILPTPIRSSPDGKLVSTLVDL